MPKLDLSWDEVVTIVRNALNAKRGVWSQIAGDLAKVERGKETRIYRWLREFSDARYEKIDGGRLARLAAVLQIPVRFSVPLTAHGLARPGPAPRKRKVRARA